MIRTSFDDETIDGSDVVAVDKGLASRRRARAAHPADLAGVRGGRLAGSQRRATINTEPASSGTA